MTEVNLRGWGRTKWFARGCFVCVTLAACGAPLSSTQLRDTTFGHAVDAAQHGDAAGAVRSAAQYQSLSTEDDPRWDRNQVLLAENLERLGLYHAASLYYVNVAASRRDPDVLDRAVAGLERLVLLGEYDESVVIEGLVARESFGSVRPERRAFLSYIEGRDSIRQGRADWADIFDTIPPESPYAARAEVVRVARLLGEGELREAGERLERLLERIDTLPEDLALEVRIALARVALEEERYGDATELYTALRDVVPRRPELLLEMAWAFFYAGNSRRALGLLLALEAPSYRGLIAPERFLLEALALRRLCQFEPARASILRLAGAHAAPLDDLHSGVRPMESESLVHAARIRVREPGSAVRTVIRIERELRRILDLDIGDTMRTTLIRAYDESLSIVRRLERRELELETQRLATELLEAEDGIRLAVHEISVALLRGRRRPDQTEEAPPMEVPAGGRLVAFRFDGEFWNDEIDDLVVDLEDRCLDRTTR